MFVDISGNKTMSFRKGKCKCENFRVFEHYIMNIYIRRQIHGFVTLTVQDTSVMHHVNPRLTL